MQEIGAYDAKTHLPSLLDRVEQGERITITRHGKPIACLVPASEVDEQRIGEVIARMNQLRKGMRLEGLSIRELIEEGRRY